MRSSVLTLRIGTIVNVVIHRSIEHCIDVSSGKDALVACGYLTVNYSFRPVFLLENQIRTLLK